MNWRNKKNWKRFLPLFFVFLFFLCTFQIFAAKNTQAAATINTGFCNYSDGRHTITVETREECVGGSFTQIDRSNPATNWGICTYINTDTSNLATVTEEMTEQDCADKSGTFTIPVATINDRDIGVISDTTASTSSDKACKFGLTNFTLDAFIGCILSLIMRLVSLLLQVAAVIFNAMIDPKIITNTLNHGAVYQLWAFVRDLVNMFFILILLFSAFATIFQISKYNFKNVLFKLILAAFLVNFSFTITRVVIDVSNIAFYSFVKLFYGQSANGNAMLLTTTDASNLADVLVPDSFPSNATQFGAIISFFLLAISFLALGILLLLRLIFLTIAIIFSPLAFISMALSNAGGFFTKWSNLLLKYSFFGPIMMFFFYVGIQFTWIINKVGFESMFATAQKNIGSGETGPGFVASMVIALVPVVVIWLGMGVASQLSIAGAEATMGRAKKLAKWAGGLPERGAKGAAKGAAKWTGIPGGVQQRWAKFKKKRFEEPRKAKEAFWAGEGKSYEESKMRTDAEELKKKNLSPEDWRRMAKSGNAAAAHLLAEGEHIDKETYQTFMSKNKNTGIADAIDSKVKKYRVDLVLENTARKHGLSRDDAAKKEMENMTAEQLAKQQWHAMTKDPGQKIDDAVGNQMRISYAGLSDKAKGEFQEKARAKDWTALTTP